MKHLAYYSIMPKITTNNKIDYRNSNTSHLIIPDKFLNTVIMLHISLGKWGARINSYFRSPVSITVHPHGSPRAFVRHINCSEFHYKNYWPIQPGIWFNQKVKTLKASNYCKYRISCKIVILIFFV